MSKIRLPSQIFCWLMACAGVPAAYAAQTDLATVPLITSAPQTVLPNLLYVLDDSGSMDNAHMPDDVENFAGRYGYASAQCNGVYYNPAITYSPPVTAAGVPYSDSSFTGASTNGFNSGAGTVNLSTSFRAYSNINGTSDTAQAAYYYRYSGTQTTEAQKNYSSGTFYNECNSNIGSTPGSTVFTKVVVSATSGPASAPDERTNFANWYTYYRTRMLMMKTSTGIAFKAIGDTYRVGYMSINNNGGSQFINPTKFDQAAKTAWYTKVYGASPNNSTPLRRALSSAGRLFANKLTTLNDVTVTDPIQYSCQKNFTVLSTDGYWNESGTIPQVDGTTDIGNQDSAEPRPFTDGGTTANIYTSSITVSGNDDTAVSTITVGTTQILSSATNSSNRSNRVAQRIAANVGLGGYTAVVSGSTVTITAPASAGAISATPVIVATGGMTFTVTPFTGSTVSVGGASDTLADVAEYYYKTDLRSTALGNELGRIVMPDGSVATPDVSTNNVLPGGEDIGTWQHMTTFSLGLGARGRMIYSPTYKSDTTGDFYSVLTGAIASSTVCTWQTAGTVCNWPTPASNTPENIDDLWHAAVNGRGTYFSATDPATLASGLNSALQEINALTSDAAAATTSNPNVTAGDNFVFSSTFRSVDWYGDLERRQINVSTGVLAATADWQARPLLDANTSRTIYTRDATNVTTGLRPFLWANLSATEQGYFSTPYISTLSQFCSSGSTCVNATNQALASGSALVNFIRGERINEGPVSATGKYFRQRTSVLGDIVNAEAVYVKTPMFSYADSGYSTYKTNNATRQGMVYVGANDGMLHAFNSDTGQEAWAYVPQTMLPSLYKLADKAYSTHHQYYVDGSPTQADVFFGGTWHTILVGGFNAGGRGFYALDVTDPANPKALWEVSNTTTGFANMGYSYGRPEITKLTNGTWVVLLTSGYNNTSPGDGKGYLYVVNAGTGALIRAIGTGQGSDIATVTGICDTTPCPSGLAQIRTWVSNTTYDNTALRAYGGDLFGNVWRFDINDNIAPSGYEAQLLATLRSASGAAQSLTAKPELGLVAGFPVVYVGTGRYLGATDLSDVSGQSLYAIKDSLGTTSLGNPRATGTTFVQQTLTSSTCPAGSAFCIQNSVIRTGSSLPVNFATNNGWFVDLPASGERASTDPQLALGTLAFTTNVLDPSACSVGGSSYANFFDYRTGAPVTTANGLVSVFLGTALATRPVQLRFSDGTVKSLIRMSDGTWQIPPTPISGSPSGTRRTSWRELVTQ